MKNFKITKQWLIKQDACEEGMKWWIRNGLEGFPSNRLKDIKGDYKSYISWLVQNIRGHTFDDNDNLIKISMEGFDGIFEKKYTYNEDNMLIHTKTSRNYTEDYVYNEKGWLILFTDSNDFKVKYTHDERGNVVYSTDTAGRSIKYTYDENNNKTSAKTSQGTQEVFSYDENNRLVKYEFVNGLAAYKEHRTYDERGNLTSIKITDGTFVEQEFDENNNAIMVKTGYFYKFAIIEHYRFIMSKSEFNVYKNENLVLTIPMDWK